MASPAANAAKYDLAQRRMNAAMARLSEASGVPVPPPIGKTENAVARHALEAERMAGFLTAIADANESTSTSTTLGEHHAQ